MKNFWTNKRDMRKVTAAHLLAVEIRDLFMARVKEAVALQAEKELALYAQLQEMAADKNKPYYD